MTTASYSANGRKLTLGPLLGKGGEGAVYQIIESPELAVKIYSGGKATERLGKIQAMISARLHSTSSFVAFPIDLVQDNKGTFSGFTMKKVAGFKTIHDLYGPGSRKNEFPKADTRFLVRAAFNLASAVASIHSTSCVIGDINHSGILVSDQALVTLIDSDSFQLKAAADTFRCLVGVAEYTPPELQGALFHKIDRTPNHDNFGLAVLLFQLLFLGRHPYSGKFLGGRDLDIKQAIGQRRFAYSARKSETQMEPPPHVPLLADFGTEVQSAFEAAFSRTNEGTGRPSSSAWVSVFGKLQNELVDCPNDKSHAYNKQVSSCPWCRLERSMGRRLFPAQYSPATPILNIGDLIALLNQQSPPASAPLVESVMPPSTGLQRSPAGKAAKKARDMSGLIAFGGLVTGLYLATQVQGFWGTALAVGSALMILRSRKPSGEGAAELRQAAEAWEKHKKIWEDHAGPTEFNRKKSHYLTLARAHSLLPQKEKEKLAELEQKKREVQFRKYMEGHLITRAKISGVGTGRKATLASYGFDSAWDVKNQSVMNVPGFGPTLATELTSWCMSVERKFVFNANVPTDPRAIQEVKNDIARQRAELERELRGAPDDLKRALQTADDLRKLPPTQLMDAYTKLKQLQLDFG